MRQIPSTAAIPAHTRNVVDALKENVEELRGVRGAKIAALPSTATLTDVISKINEMIAKNQG